MKDEKQLKIIEAAKEIFSRYGFKRTTMGDIAEAVGMSRPALYLVYPSKEDILAAVVDSMCHSTLSEIRQQLPLIETAKDKLKFAFEVWSVRPFEMVQTFPDTKDLLENTHKFAGQITSGAFTEFENILEGILEPLVDASQSKSKLSPKQLAHILTSAIYGFKNAAGNVAELRQLFDDLITVILESLQSRNI